MNKKRVSLCIIMLFFLLWLPLLFPVLGAPDPLEYDYVDNNTSNVDSFADRGSHSNFSAQQHGPDGIRDTLEEGDSAGGIVYVNSAESYSATGRSSHNFNYALQRGSGNYRLVVVTVSWEDAQASASITSLTFGGTSMIKIADITAAGGYTEYISLWYLLDASLPINSGSFNIVVTVSEIITREIYVAVVEYSGVKQSAPDDYDAYALTGSGSVAVTLTAATDGSIVVAGVGEGGTNVLTNTNNIVNLQEQRLTSSGSALGHRTNVNAGDITVGWNSLSTREGMVGAVWQPARNYRLDLEVQWTNARYNQTYEELCIYAGTLGAENLRVDVWTGSTWQNLFTDLSSGWNNISVTDYLTSSTFTIRFNGGTETGDNSQNSWEIDCTLLHTWGIPPTANFSHTPEYTYTSETVTFNASTSYDSDGTIVSYFWDFGDGTNATGEITNHTYTEDGIYTVTLIVTDNDDLTDTTQKDITVLNKPPTVAFTESAESVLTGEIIYFNATASYDPDGYIVSYLWDFGDGSNATGANVQHAYGDNGTFTVTLTVTDDDGATNAATSTKTILNRTPVAMFTESAETFYTSEAITFNASGSYDIDGTITQYFWDFGDGSNASGVVVSHTYANDGNYTVTLTIIDNDGATASTSATKTVLNRAPKAAFTESAETLYTNEIFYFNASDSYDPDGSIVSYFWNFGDGTNTTGVVVSHAYSEIGNYTVTLTVTDDDGATALTSATKTVLNRPPVASFTESAETAYTGEAITFNASNSYDPDGSIISYYWNFGDGTNATGVIVSHAYTDNGNYIVTLTVTDNQGAIGSTNTTKTILNRSPSASFTESAETVYTNTAITFNASTSYDPDGSIITYFWDFGDGTNATGMVVEHTYLDNGNYTVTLTVTDDDGATDTTTSSKTVLNRPPVASFTESAETVYTGEAITFDASGSYDSDGVIVSYFWDFGDGTNATGVSVAHTYIDNGNYTVTLTITDDDGVTHSAVSSKTVLNRPPVAVFTESAETVYTSETITFNTSDSYDPDGSVVSYFWDFGDGTNATGIVVSHSYMENGNYTVTLTVTDDEGATGTTSATKTILNRTPVATFTESAETVYTGDAIMFNASNSYDPDGSVVSYFWDFGDGTNATGVVVGHAYADDGNYTVTLTITDNDGASTSASATKAVLNRSPVAAFTESLETVFTNEVITFNASDSYDLDGSIVEFFWDFGDGSNASGMVVSHAYADDGSYTVTLTITDDDGAIDTAFATKTVLNRAPVASFTESAETVYTGETITFNASASYDSDGIIVNYFWDFGNGANATGVVVYHSYAEKGNYTVTLTVTDDDVAASLASATKTVLNRPPIASFTESAETVYTGESITFNASNSYDLDGAIVSYFWDFGDGTNSTGIVVDYVYADDGSYMVTLTVTDNEGAIASTSATKTVLNRVPVASFTESAETVYTGDIITFNASGSYDLDGSILSYFWDFGDGTNSTGVVVTHSYIDDGNYVVTLTVTDDDGATASSTSTKTVLNRPPVASFTESAQTVYTGETITFNASNSYDPDGTITNYFWDFGDGTNATGIIVSHAYADDGNYTVTLTITDDNSATDSISSTKVVLNRVPVASFTESAETVYTNESVMFNASGSYDPDGSVVSYFWDFGDGTNSSGVVVGHVYAEDGNYTVTLIITDDDDATASASATKTVLNRPPVASFTESSETVYTSEAISFNASDSYDPDGSIVSYFWNFGDGNNATGAVVSHSYIDNGDYIVTLTVTDNDGASSSISATKTVLNRAPTASFTESAQTVYTSVAITFDASASYDPDGFIASYFWDFGDGTNVTGIVVSHAYADDGAYIVTLTATDNDGGIDTATSSKMVLNRNPTAAFSESAATVYTGEGITFNASSSFDPDGSIVSYFWDFGDGTVGSGVVVTHAYTDNGTYTVKLTVIDDDDASNTATSTKTVLNRPPVASFTESAETAYIGDSISFNASDSYDPDGVVVSYFWDFGDGTNATGVTVENAYSDHGNYTVTLTVTDNDGATASISATKTVLNRSPVVVFTESAESVVVGEIIYFNASNSYDLDGVVVSYFWDFGDGSNATGITAQHAYTDSGVYVVTLIVTDDDGATGNASAQKTVEITLPVASFTESAETVYTGETITFNASGSYDPDGVIVSYFWDFGDGTNATGVVVEHSYANNSNYTVTLTVTDDDGATDSTSATKIVLNRLPIASFSESAETVYTSETISFNASDSYDPDGVIANYFWDFGDGFNATGVVVVHSYADNGNYTVTLAITDDDGASSSVTATKTILNRAPVASFTESAETVYTGEIITFNASNSYDSDGVIVSYFWDFGDGANATGAVVSHFYVDDGSYTVTLTVTDDDGGVSTSTTTKTVLNRLPVASFTENVETVYTNEAFMFNASASYDPDGIIVRYYWDFGDGTNATGAVVEHVYSNSGNYIVTLTVTDDDGATASATSVKTVLNRSPVAVFSWSPDYPILGEIVTFNASNSYDSDGLILSYEWNFGDGNVTTTSTPIITHVYANIGNYTVVLIITDDDGLSGTATNVLSVREYPTAVFTYSPGVPLVGQTVSFNASSSTPNGGTITNYEWNFGDGNITSTTSPLITHIYSTHGNLTVTLTVTDSEGLSDIISEIVTVEQPPIASFTYSPTSIIAGNVVTFNASESNDPGGYIVTYLWNFGDGNITTTTNPIITHVYTSHGSYTVSLTVTDNDGYTSTITKSFYVKEYPVASFTYSPSSPATGEIVTFDASSSQPKGGIIILYSWNFGDSSPLANTTTPTTTHIYTVAGNYTVTLTITDSERLSNSASKALSISVKPVAIFTYSPGVPYVGGTVTFNASDSYDPDGYLVSYAWNFGDYSPPLSGNNSVVTHVYSAAGNYTVTLTVTDNEGFTKQTTKIVSVFKSPVASFYYYPKNPIWGEYITFNASASYDINGYIVRYYWNFGDGSVANVTTPVVTHMYAVDKTYTVTLTVTDNDGYRDQTSTTVKVRPPGYPVAYFTYSPSFPKVNEVVTFNASQSYDPNGNIGSYYWDFGDGSTKMVLYNPIVTHTYTNFGSYKVTLRVTDNQGNTDSVSLTLIVRANPEANFTWQPQTPLINQTITFDASSSKPNGGTIVSYTWDFGDGNITITTSPSITHRYYSASDFAVTLTVKDSENLTDDAISNVRVQQPPVAEFTYSPQFPNAWETVTFNASSSYGFNSVIVQYRWDFGDGNITTTTSKIITHVYKAGGNLVVTLRVTDSNGLWSTKSKPIDIVGGPTAEFTWYPIIPKPNQTAIFDATSSTLGWNGTHHPNIVSYAWDFGDGNITTTTNATIKHVYSQQAYYTVTLTITDDNGRQDNVTHTVQVSLTTLRGDITGPQGVPDGKVDIMDLALVSACFGSYPGHPKWDPRADVTGPGDAPDGKVDIMDVALVSSQFGMYV